MSGSGPADVTSRLVICNPQSCKPTEIPRSSTIQDAAQKVDVSLRNTVLDLLTNKTLQ